MAPVFVGSNPTSLPNRDRADWYPVQVHYLDFASSILASATNFYPYLLSVYSSVWSEHRIWDAGVASSNLARQTITGHSYNGITLVLQISYESSILSCSILIAELV